MRDFALERYFSKWEFTARYTGPKDTNQFREDLVNDIGILLLPSNIFTSELLSTPQDGFRVGFGREGMDEALSVFRQYLSSRV